MFAGTVSRNRMLPRVRSREVAPMLQAITSGRDLIDDAHYLRCTKPAINRRHTLR